MESESPRRRVRRAKQSRPIAPGHAEPTAGMERQPSPPVGAEPTGDAAVAQPDVPADIAVGDPEWEPDTLPNSGRDGAWLPAGIAVLVMVSLLVCAGLVLIASRQ